MNKALKLLTAASLTFGVGLATQGIAGAAPNDGPAGPPGAFLCPALGDGVLVAAGNGALEVGVLGNGSYTFLPGNNQAGLHANANAHNEEGPMTSPGPGDGNSDWSPIWPPSETC